MNKSLNFVGATAFVLSCSFPGVAKEVMSQTVSIPSSIVKKSSDRQVLATKSSLESVRKLLAARKYKVAALVKEKGHDRRIYAQLALLHGEIESLERNFSELKALAGQTEMEVKEIAADVADIDSLLEVVGKMKAKASKVFPSACGNPVMTAKFEVHAGIVERSPTRKLVFAKGDAKARDGSRKILLSDKVGLAGSSISDPSFSITRANHYVEAYVDPKGGKGNRGIVMCVSSEIPTSMFEEKKKSMKYKK